MIFITQLAKRAKTLFIQLSILLSVLGLFSCLWAATSTDTISSHKINHASQDTIAHKTVPNKTLYTGKTPTLTAWTSTCFSQLPEYSNNYKTILTAQDVTDMLKDFRNLFKNSAFRNSKNWLEAQVPNSDFWAGKHAWDYVQKYETPVDSQTCFIGDIHGCVHSLLRTLWGLVAEDKLDDNFKLTKNINLICLGDYFDRGLYSIEVLHTLYLLKKANPTHVHLLRGNHEYEALSRLYSFAAELKEKFGKQPAHDLLASITNLVRCFPLALLLKSGDSVIQCCHGGLNPGYKPQRLINSTLEIFEKIPGTGAHNKYNSENRAGNGFPNWAGNFNWTDFSGTTIKGGVSFSGRGYKFDKNWVNAYLTENGIGLNGFIRGHQHYAFGFKMPENNHWTSVIPKCDRNNNEFFISKIQMPVFTFSSASGTPLCGQPYDCYGILTTAHKWDGWKLKIYESKTPLEAHVTNYAHAKKRPTFKTTKYIEIDIAKTSSFKNELPGMAIAAHWVDEKKRNIPIGAALIKKARELAIKNSNCTENNT
ncbi:MAG: metallophosphoesterase family protein [bacterium]